MGFYWTNFLKEYPESRTIDLEIVLEAFWHYCHEPEKVEDILNKVKE